MPDDFIELPGSHREPHAGATILGEANPDEQAQITIVLTDGADVNAIDSWLTGQGLAPFIEHGLFKVRGSIHDIIAAFGIDDIKAAQTAEGVPFRQRTGPLHIPARFEHQIVAVLGTDNRPVAKPHFRLHPDASAGYTAAQIATIYSFPIGEGLGRTIDIIELGGGFSPADCTAAWRESGQRLSGRCGRGDKQLQRQPEQR